MDVAVVVATRNRRDSLATTLARLAELPERPRVIVVDNGSSDGTAAMVSTRFPQVELVALGDNRGAAARTAGVERAGTAYVAFADDDSWWEPGALSRAAHVLDAHPDVAVVAGRVLVGPRGELDPACAAMAASPLDGRGLPGRAVLGFVACGAVVRREAYLAAGGFDSRLGIGGEEQPLAIELARRGRRLVYLPDVVARHHPSPARDPRARASRQARNALWVAWLRRPLGTALAATVRGLRRPRAVAATARALPWIVRERRPVGRELEAQLRLIDRPPAAPRAARAASRAARAPRA